MYLLAMHQHPFCHHSFDLFLSLCTKALRPLVLVLAAYKFPRWLSCPLWAYLLSLCLLTVLLGAPWRNEEPSQHQLACNVND